MKMRSRTAVLVGALVLVVLTAGGLAITRNNQGETCFDRLGGPGPNSNTPRLDTLLDIPSDQWPLLVQLLKGFAAERGWAVQEGPGTTDPTYAWLDMCDSTTIVRANNRYESDDRIGFGIIHMTYEGAGKDRWQPIYREIHRRVEARWPGRLRYREGEFGRMIERPGWLDRDSAPVAAVR